MRQKWPNILGSLTAALLLGMSGCAHELRLVEITVHPATVEFFTPNPGSEVHFTAIGTYIHPPGTRDITNQVTWGTAIPQLLNVNGGVVSPTGAGCGVADVSASLNKNTGNSANVVIGYATVTVNDPSDPLCPGGSSTRKVLAVTLSGPGTGVVTSSPSGINCPGQCGAQFDVGSTITLTPTPNGGSTFGGWNGCNSTSGNDCSVVLTGDTTVTATFN
jgi:hypothetical protein